MTRQAAAPPMMTIVLVAVVVEEEAATQMGARSVAEHSSLAAPRTGPVRISAMTRHSAHHVVGLVDLHCIRSSVLGSVDIQLLLRCTEAVIHARVPARRALIPWQAAI